MDGADRPKKKDIETRISELAERAVNAQSKPKESPFTKKVPSDQNLLTKSTVKTENEMSAERLEQIRAYREQMNANSIREANRQRFIKKIIKIVVVALLVALGIAVIWLVVETVLIARQPVAPAKKEKEEVANVTEIGNYKCETELCSKLVDLPGGQIILRDTKYYIYDPETKDKKLTTIEEKSYRDASVFYWGDHLMLVLSPVTGRSALFSITDNRSISDFNYDSFISNEKDTAYASMEWVVGRYIIGKNDSNLHFIDINTGKDLFHANKKVFIHDKFCFAYEKKGEVRAYTLAGKKFATFKVADDFFIRGDYLYIVPKGESEEGRTEFKLYDEAGRSIQDDNQFYENLSNTIFAESDNYAVTLKQRQDTYTVPKF